MERYQEAYTPGAVAPGERAGEARWALVRPHVPDRGVLLDIGSNLGYFGLRAAEEHPELAVVSLEADPVIAARQAAVVAAHPHHRMVVLQGTVSAATAARWAETCDQFDLTLLLAVLHWVDDPAAVVRSLSSMSARLVCEVPDPADEGACGPEKLALWADPVAWFADVTGRPVREIGRMERHTSHVPSHVVLVDGPVRRRPRRAYWDGPDLPPGSVEIAADGAATTFTKDGRTRAYEPGVNLVDLMRVGALRHPPVRWWLDTCGAELRANPAHPDPYPHNLVWSAAGVRLVDWDPVDALLTTADGLRTLEVHLPRWAAGETVGDEVLVREASWSQRLRSSPPGRAALDRVPPGLKRWVRRRLFGR